MNDDDLQYDPDATTHPGETLREVLDEAHALFVDNDVERGDDNPSLLSVRRCLADIPADSWLERQRNFDDQPTVEKLASVVRGEWSQTHTNFDVYSTEGPPTYNTLQYDIGEDASNLDVDQYKACAHITGGQRRLAVWSYGDTPLAALRALVLGWGDEIRRFSGTIHPNELEGDTDD